MRYEANRGSPRDYDVAARRCEEISLQMESLRSQATGAAASHPAPLPTATGQPTSQQQAAKEQQKEGNRKERRSRQHAERNNVVPPKPEKERKKKKRKPDSDIAAAAQEASSNEQAMVSAEEQTQGKQKKQRQKLSKKQPELTEETQAAKAVTDNTAAPTAEATAIMTVESLDAATAASAVPGASAQREERASGEEEFRVEHPTRTLLVSKLPADATEATLITTFAKYGQIEMVKLLPASSGAEDDGRRAYVVYSSKDAVKPALAARDGDQKVGNGLQVEAVSHVNKRLKQQQKAQQPRPLSVFLRSLPPLADMEAAIRRHFAACGEIARVRLLRDRDGQLKPTAYVDFTQREAAEKAMRMDGQPMEGTAIRVGPDLPLAVRQQQQQQRRGREREEAKAAAATAAGAGNAQHVRLEVIGRQMGRLQLLPRTVQTSSASSSRKDPAAVAADDAMEEEEVATAAATNAEAPPAPVKSNSDFRALLLRK